LRPDYGTRLACSHPRGGGTRTLVPPRTPAYYRRGCVPYQYNPAQNGTLPANPYAATVYGRGVYYTGTLALARHLATS